MTAESELVQYKLEQLKVGQDDSRIILVEHINEDHKLQSEINISLSLIKHDLTAIKNDQADMKNRLGHLRDFKLTAMAYIGGVIGVITAVVWLYKMLG